MQTLDWSVSSGESWYNDQSGLPLVQGKFILFKIDPTSVIDIYCHVSQEGSFASACSKYTEALKIIGYNAELSYNIALCHYQMRQFVPALKYIADIIEKGIRDHPGKIQFDFFKKKPPKFTSSPVLIELSVGMATEGIEVRSVGNSQTLHETFLIEAFNLKAAIEYQLKNCEFEVPINIHCYSLVHMLYRRGCKGSAYRHASSSGGRIGPCYTTQLCANEHGRRSYYRIWKTQLFAATNTMPSGSLFESPAPVRQVRILRFGGRFIGREPAYCVQEFESGMQARASSVYQASLLTLRSYFLPFM